MSFVKFSSPKITKKELLVDKAEITEQAPPKRGEDDTKVAPKP